MNAFPSGAPGASADFLIVTALPEELDAVLGKIPGHRLLPPSQEDIRAYYQAELPVRFPDGSSGSYRVVVMGLLGMGRIQAATAASDAIRRWRPRYVLLIGIAGGIAGQDICVGDVLISDQVVDYELQKITPDGPEIRWDVYHTDARLLNACKYYRDEGWQARIQVERPGAGKSGLGFGVIASGDKVVAFPAVLKKYRAVWPKLVGVEMEASGVATAAFQAPDRPGFFMIRGVSDLADEHKDSAPVKQWRAYACEVAAAYAIAMLQSGPVPLAAPIAKPTAAPIAAPIAKPTAAPIARPSDEPAKGGPVQEKTPPAESAKGGSNLPNSARPAAAGPLKVLVADEREGTAIWKALNRLKPAIGVSSASVGDLGAFLAAPGAYQVLVMSLDAWLGLGMAIRARLSQNIQLLCLYHRQAVHLAAVGTAALGALVFAPLEKPGPEIAAALRSVADGTPLGELPAVSSGTAQCQNAAFRWQPPVRKAEGRSTLPASPARSAQAAPTPAPTHPARSGTVIHNLHVDGDIVYGDKVSLSSAANQQVELHVQGEAHITQAATGDQVNVNQVSGGSTPAIQQTAGGDQVNVNNVSSPANAGPAPVHCWKCHVEVKPGMSFCTNCGTRLELNDPGSPSSADLTPGHCWKCHAEVKPGVRFCTTCGASLEGK